MRIERQLPPASELRSRPAGHPPQAEATVDRVELDSLRTAARGLNSRISSLVGGVSALFTGVVPPAYEVGLKTMGVPQLREAGLSGKGITVALVDSGANLDDHVVAAANFADERPDVHDGNGHGTRMASLIHDVAPEVNLAVLKVSNDYGHIEVPSVLAALDWVDEHRAEHNIQVVNLSIGGFRENPPELLDRLRHLGQEGVLVCTSAGNDGPQAPLEEFKHLPEVLSVANFHSRRTVNNEDDRLAAFSTRQDVTLAAPGSDVVAPGRWFRERTPGGTSEAAALASGLMALWKEKRPDLTAPQAKDLIAASPLQAGGVPVPSGPAILQS